MQKRLWTLETDLVFKARPKVRELSEIVELLYILIEVLVTRVDILYLLELI